MLFIQSSLGKQWLRKKSVSVCLGAAGSQLLQEASSLPTVLCSDLGPLLCRLWEE